MTAIKIIMTVGYAIGTIVLALSIAGVFVISYLQPTSGEG
jgi:hypothetical protein